MNFSTHFHPMLSHFPIVLIILGFVAELIVFFSKKETYLSKIGFYILVLGALTAFFAWISGEFFTEELTGPLNEVREMHEHFVWVSLGLLAASCIFKYFSLFRKPENKNLKWAAFIFYALTAISFCITGYYGGTLVYDYLIPA